MKYVVVLKEYVITSMVYFDLITDVLRLFTRVSNYVIISLF
jgi:hypothetical protein